MKDLLSSYIKISEAEYELFISKSKLIHYKKNEHLLNADTSVNEIFFIKQGLVRGYRIIDGNDKCFWTYYLSAMPFRIRNNSFSLGL